MRYTFKIAAAVILVLLISGRATAQQPTSSFGGLFSLGDCGSWEQAYANNFTGANTCPDGYVVGPNWLDAAGCTSYSPGGCGFRSLYSLCGYNYWFCYNGAASNMEFGGMFQIQLCNKSHDPYGPSSTLPNIGNLVVSQVTTKSMYNDALGCPVGFIPVVAALFSNDGTECPSSTFACVKPFQSGVSVLGGFYQEQAFPNPNTGTYGCPSGYSAVAFATSDNYDRGDGLVTAYYCRLTSAPQPPTAPPSPGVPSTCCFYYRTEEKEETSMCVRQGDICPAVVGYYAVGNSSVPGCDQCRS